MGNSCHDIDHLRQAAREFLDGFWSAWEQAWDVHDPDTVKQLVGLAAFMRSELLNYIPDAQRRPDRP